MGRIIRKVNLNRRTKQLTISIPKKEFKRLNPNTKVNKDSLFEIRPLKRKNGKP